MENADGQEKTEAPSGKRLSDARNRGQVAKSADVTSAAILLLGGMAVYNAGPALANNLILFLQQLFINAGRVAITDDSSITYFRELIITVAIFLLPILLIIMTIAISAEIGQVGFHFAPEKFTKGLNFASVFNPFTGIKKLFLSKQTAIELLKSVSKLLIVGGVLYSIINNNYLSILELASRPYHDFSTTMISVTYEIFWKVGLVYALLAAGDFFWQKYQFTEQLKMTKQEVKEENKQMEGDMQAKARMKQIGRDRIRRAMLQKVKTADVVITNPTHFAVALKYDQKSMQSPIVVAKGIDNLALKIREIATQHNIPIVENPPLARELYKLVEVEKTIPESLFKAVAQVLAYVYKLRRERQNSW